MNGQVAILLSFVVYLTFFGWLGWRRGVTRELIVFLAALLGWLALQQRGETIVNMANLMAAGLDFARAGGFSGSQEEAFAALASAPSLVTSDTQNVFLYVIWVAGVILIYLGTNWIIADYKSRSNGWSILLGMLNGLFFAIIFLPGMFALFSAEGTVPESEEGVDLLGMLGKGLQLVWDGIVAAWNLITPFGPTGVLVLVTGVLVVAALSIRNSAKAKS
jgi:succinate dehydrogenase hydrophobic anchor subunit